MEVLADRQFRAAIAHVGGMDEMVMEFIRIPDNGHAPSLARRYQSDELGHLPLAPQVMGSHDERMYEITRQLVARGAHRVDLNCGCPAKRVTNKGSGASLLKTPSVLGDVVRSMVGEGSDKFENVTVKMRSGFADTGLFLENLMAAIDGGARAVTIHPRTSRQRYDGSADWRLIKLAADHATVPIVGNGDVKDVAGARLMLESTGCDALMIGRGAVRNPWLFRQIRASLAGEEVRFPSLAEELAFWRAYMQAGVLMERDEKGNIGRMKMIARYYFDRCAWLRSKRQAVLQSDAPSAESFYRVIAEVLEQHSTECTSCPR